MRKGKIKAGMSHPTVALCVVLIVFLVMLTFIVPVLKEMFTGFGGQLPAFTQCVIDLSGMMRFFWMVLLLSMVGGVIWRTKRHYKTGASCNTRSGEETHTDHGNHD